MLRTRTEHNAARDIYRPTAEIIVSSITLDSDENYDVWDGRGNQWPWAERSGVDAYALAQWLCQIAFRTMMIL